MRAFNRVVTVNVTTGLAAVEVFPDKVQGEVFGYTMRGDAGTDNTNLDFYLADRVNESGEDTTPAALPAAEYRVVDDTSNVPTVHATTKFGGSTLAQPSPFKAGLWLYVSASGGTTGNYTFAIRGRTDP